MLRRSLEMRDHRPPALFRQSFRVDAKFLVQLLERNLLFLCCYLFDVWGLGVPVMNLVDSATVHSREMVGLLYYVVRNLIGP